MISFDPGIVAIIVAAGVLGWPLNKVIKWLKDALRAKGVLIYVVELLVCGAATAFYLFGVGIVVPIVEWSLANLALYTALVFASVHGFYVKAK